MTTLTSTGAVNLTASTNWSPAQIPVAGDDLIIGAHTLTLDADLTLNSVTFNNASARMAISGTSRHVQATNGWIGAVAWSAQLITAAIPSGTSLTLSGTWSGNVSMTNIASSTGGNLTLQTIGADAGGILFADVASTVTRVITNSWAGGTLTTVGRFNLPNWAGGSTVVTISAGTWNHTHTGVSYIGNGAGAFRMLSQAATAIGSWTGDVEAASIIASSGLFFFAGSGNWTITGNILLTAAAPSAGAYTAVVGYSNATHTLTVVGKLCCRGKAVSIYGQLGSGGRINWRNQTVSIGSSEHVVMYMNGTGTLDLTDLVVSNAGKFLILVSAGTTSVAAGASTLITNTTTAAQAAVYTAAGELDGKVINLASDAPTLPAVEDVAGGTTYGYTISPLTGTGIVNDPAVIAAAVGTALENISAAALARFVTVDTGETIAGVGAVASFGGGGATVEDIWTHETRTLTEAVELGSAITTQLDAIETDAAASVGYLTSLASSMATLLGRVTAPVYALWTDLIQMVTGDGTVDAQWSAKSLELGPVGSGGSGNWTEEQVTYAIQQLALLEMNGSAVVIPAGTFLCTRGDIEQVYGAVSVAAWADLNNTGDADEILARINYRIVMADNYIRSVLENGPWAMPAEGDLIPSILAYNAAALAGVYLYEARGVQDYNAAGYAQHQLSYHKKNVEDFLKGVLVGSISLKPLKYNIASAAPEAS